MPEPLVSVIIPAFNAAKTVARALDSVRAQTFADYELVVVDDGSSDDLATSLRPYQSLVTLIRQSNRGAAAARNLGVARSAGRLIAFLDADDFWHVRKLELQCAAFRARPDISYCWAAGRPWTEGEANPQADELTPSQTVPRFESDFRKVFLAPWLGTPGVMIRRDVFATLGGFREDLTSAEDVDLWLRAAYQRITAHVPALLFFTVAQPGSITARHMERTYADNLKVIDDFCLANPAFLREEGACVRRARAKVYENWASSALVRNDTGLARRLLWQSLRCHLSLRAVRLLAKACARGGAQASPD